MKCNRILGFSLKRFNSKEAIEYLSKMIYLNESCKLAFLNANLCNIANSDDLLKDKLKKFVLLNDGSGLNLATKLLGQERFPENLNGTDFTPEFLDHIDMNLKVFLIGSRPKVIQKSVDVFKQKWPQHHIVGFQHGFYDPAELPEILNRIKASAPDIVFVGMGNGLQEYLVDEIVPKYALSAWGVGACFEFISNQLPRAPKWMRQFGLEWIYRLILEPKRLWKRYLIGNFIFIFNVIVQRLSQK